VFFNTCSWSYGPPPLEETDWLVPRARWAERAESGSAGALRPFNPYFHGTLLDYGNEAAIVKDKAGEVGRCAGTVFAALQPREDRSDVSGSVGRY
jgi:hypothetical protein